MDQFQLDFTRQAIGLVNNQNKYKSNCKHSHSNKKPNE